MMKDLKIVFMGTPDFSVPVLKMLIENCNVQLVVTQPDKIVGRNHELSYSPIKKVALENNIEVFQPIRIRKEYQKILEINPDMIITCAYGQIIPKVLLDLPKYGCINVHASLLPKLRGGAPLHHSIIDGYQKTGITIMYMDEGMDDGDIITQESIDILDSDNVGTIHDKLSPLGAELLRKTLPNIISGNITRTKQDINQVTFGYNISREEEILDFNKTAREIFNKVRGLNPFPVSYLNLESKILKIYEVKYKIDNQYEEKENGEIVIQSKKELGIKCEDGIIFIESLKKEGKKKMNIIEFLNGNNENFIGKKVNDEK